MTQIVLDDGARPLRVARRASMTAIDFGLYAFTVVAWSTSWFAMHMQVGVVAPEVSLVWRFLIATVLMFIWAAASGARLSFPAATHLRFAALGALLFSLNFVCFYYAGMSTPSGLLSVVFSCAALVNLGLGALFFGEAIERRVVLGAAVGLGGVVMMSCRKCSAHPSVTRHWSACFSRRSAPSRFVAAT